MPKTKHEQILKLLLRVIGSVALLAFFCAMMPHSWMNATHQWLGLGEMPNEPIVGYLARSTSAFYALLGGLLWVVSWDLRRHWLVMIYLSCAFIVFGVLLLAVDFFEGLPLYWVLGEGPFNIVAGLVFLYLLRQMDSSAPHVD